MATRRAVAAARRYLQILSGSGLEVPFVVLFGSHVNGTPDEWSDIDLIVVSPYFDTHREHGDIDVLWRLTLQADAAIEPIACGLCEWKEDDGRPILEIARRQGRVIRAAAV